MIKAPDVTAFYVVLAFIVSYVMMKRFLFRPLGAILEAREQEESAAAKIHAESRRELERAIAEGEEKLAAARREALKAREALRAEGLARFEQELARARQGATSSVEAATRAIDTDASLAATELGKRAPALAVELAERILGRKLAA